MFLTIQGIEYLSALIVFMAMLIECDNDDHGNNIYNINIIIKYICNSNTNNIYNANDV